MRGGAAFRAQKEEALPILRHAVVARVQNLPRECHRIACCLKLGGQFVEKLTVLADGEPSDVLEDEDGRLELDDEAEEVLDELIPGVVESPFPDHGKSLAGCASDDDVYRSRQSSADVRRTDLGSVDAHRPALREVERVRRRVDGVDLNCGYDIEPGLLETEPQSADAGEHVQHGRAGHEGPPSTKRARRRLRGSRSAGSHSQAMHACEPPSGRWRRSLASIALFLMTSLLQ